MTLDPSLNRPAKNSESVGDVLRDQALSRPALKTTFEILGVITDELEPAERLRLNSEVARRKATCETFLNLNLTDRELRLALHLLRGPNQTLQAKEVFEYSPRLARIWSTVQEISERSGWYFDFLRSRFIPTLSKEQNFSVANNLSRLAEIMEIIKQSDSNSPFELLQESDIRLSASQLISLSQFIAVAGSQYFDETVGLIEFLPHLSDQELDQVLVVFDNRIRRVRGFAELSSEFADAELSKFVVDLDPIHLSIPDYLKEESDYWSNSRSSVESTKQLLLGFCRDFPNHFGALVDDVLDLLFPRFTFTRSPDSARERWGKEMLVDIVVEILNTDMPVEETLLNLMAVASAWQRFSRLWHFDETTVRWFQIARTLLDSGLTLAFHNDLNRITPSNGQIGQNSSILADFQGLYLDLISEGFADFGYNDEFSEVSDGLGIIFTFIATEPSDKICREIFTSLSSYRHLKLEDLQKRLKNEVSYHLIRDLLRTDTEFRDEKREFFRVLHWSDGPPTPTMLDDGSENPRAKLLQRQSSEIISRSLVLTESFSAFTIDARHAPDGEVPILARFMLDISAKDPETGSKLVWAVNSKSKDTYPGRGMGCRINLGSILPEVWHQGDPFGGYKNAWRHLSPSAITEINGTEAWMLRGLIVLQRSGPGYDFASIPMSLVIRNDHYFNPGREGVYLVSSDLILPALRKGSFSLEDGFRSNHSTPEISQVNLLIEDLRLRSTERNLPFLELTAPANLFGTLAKAPEPFSLDYHSRELELFRIDSYLPTDSRGHIHHAYWYDGVHIERTAKEMRELERALLPARLAAKHTYELSKRYLDLFDALIALRAYWSQYGRVVDPDEIDSAMTEPRELAPLNSSRRVTASEYMLREAWRYQGRKDAPIFIAVDQRSFGTSLKSPWYIDPMSWRALVGDKVIDLPRPHGWPNRDLSEVWQRDLASNISQIHMILPVERHRIAKEIIDKLA